MTISSFNKGPDNKRIIEMAIKLFYICPNNKRIIKVTIS